MATFTIITEPLGSQLTSTIASNEDDAKNDFSVYIVGNQNVSGLALSGTSVSSGEIISLEGENSVWKATVRPPESSEVITFTIAADAVTEGNPETTQDIRVSTAFPDDDAETFTQLSSVTAATGIAVTPTRILLNQGGDIEKYAHDGTSTGEAAIDLGRVGKLDSIGNDFLIGRGQFGRRLARYTVADGTQVFTLTQDRFGVNIAHTRLGYADVSSVRLRILAYAYESESDWTETTLPESFKFTDTPK